MQKYSEREALWIPLVSRSFTVWLLYSQLILLAILATFSPDHPPKMWLAIAELINFHIESVGSASSASVFPFATTISYSLPIVLAPFFAALISLTPINLSEYKKHIDELSAIKRYLLLPISLLILISPLSSSEQISTPFFYLLSSNRMILILWSEGIFIFFCSVWLLVFFEIKNIFIFFTRK